MAHKNKKFMYEIRFRHNGKPKTYRTTAKSPEVAARKLRSSGTIISVLKVRT